MRFLVFVPLILTLLVFAACGAHYTEKLSIAASQGNIPELRHLLLGQWVQRCRGSARMGRSFGTAKCYRLSLQRGADPNGTAGRC